MVKKCGYIAASLLLLASCNSTQFKRPQLDYKNCAVYHDIEKAECYDEHGMIFYTDAFGFRVISVEDEKKIIKYQLDLERCILNIKRNHRAKCNILK